MASARVTNALLLAALALVSCKAQSPGTQHAAFALPPSSVSTLAFDTSLVPPASGDGNFEICLTNDAAENGITHVNLPPNVLFQSWGPLGKSLRERDNYDEVASTDHPELTAYALVTTMPVSLSKAKPCTITTARIVTNDGFKWTQASVPASLHYVFAPQPMMLKGSQLTTVNWGESVTGKPNGRSRGGKAGDAIGNAYLSGIPVKDIAGAIPLADSDDVTESGGSN